MIQEEQEALENEQVVARWEQGDESDEDEGGGDTGKMEHGEDARATAMAKKEKDNIKFDDLYNRATASVRDTHVDSDTKRVKASKPAAAIITARWLYKKEVRALDSKEKQHVVKIIDSMLHDRAGRMHFEVMKGVLFDEKARMNGRYPEERKVKMTPEQDFEYKMAFSVVAGVEEGSIATADTRIDVTQLDEVFMALGLTMQDSDLEQIVNGVELDDDGLIGMDELRESFEAWRIKQIDVDVLQAIFNMLVEEKGITSLKKFPEQYVLPSFLPLFIIV
jgi:hypothetical protein